MGLQLFFQIFGEKFVVDTAVNLTQDSAAAFVAAFVFQKLRQLSAGHSAIGA